MVQNMAFEIYQKKQKQNYRVTPHSDIEFPKVDLLIPTLNEPIEILRDTIVCAKKNNYPNLTINILDDGNRSEVRELCHTLHVTYHTRPTNRGAKAGNMNDSLSNLNGQYIAILDADFLSHNDFVTEGVKHFDDPNVACVQFPQVFYNQDPTQKSSDLFATLKDEQFKWYHVLLPARNEVNLATSCGSCSLVSRKALDVIGGQFPEDTVTEDFDMSLRFIAAGYYTKYVHKSVALGLHAFTVEAFFKQRVRWAKGNVHAWILYAKRRKYRIDPKTFLIFEWRFFSLPARLVTLLAPTLILLFDIPPLKVYSTLEYIAFTLPFILTMLMYELEFQKKSLRNLTFTLARDAGMAISLGTTFLKEMISIKKIKFESTPKDKKDDKNTVNFDQKKIIAILTAGLFALLFKMSNIEGESFKNSSSLVPIYWQIWNLFFLFYAVKIFNDRTPRRQFERLRPVEPSGAILYLNDNTRVGHGKILDASENSISIEVIDILETDQVSEVKFIELSGIIFECYAMNIEDNRSKEKLVFKICPHEREPFFQYLFSGKFEPLKI